MKKNMISLFTITSMLFMQTSKADQPSEPNLIEESTSIPDPQSTDHVSVTSPGSEMTHPPLSQEALPTQASVPQMDTSPSLTPSQEISSDPSQGEMRSVPLNPQPDSSTASLNTIDTAATDSNTTDPTVSNPSDEGTSVGQASNAGAKTARNRAWKNIGLAIGAIAVAIVALILVSKNSGHSK